MSNFVIVEQLSLTITDYGSPSQHPYSLEEAAQHTAVHPDLLRYYCRAGLLGEARANPEEEPTFDDDCLYEIRRIEHYRHHHSVNLRALPLLLGLLREIDSLRRELRFVRES